MPNTLLGLSFDAHDALALATFWAATLQRDVAPGSTVDEASVLASDADSAPLLTFRRVGEGRVGKNRLHLDVMAADLESEGARLLALGARRVTRVVHGAVDWVTLSDPEGNEFDLIAR
jgi:hypothetical protein